MRDLLLGLPAGDYDWVVVGATPEQMVENGYQPVGGDFPVFLHPRTHEEYALARTERKSGRGYQGFTFYTGADVSLEQDLLRRDLTVNAMALSKEGQRYLQQQRRELGAAQLNRLLQSGALDQQLTAGDPPYLSDPFDGLKDLRQKLFRHVSEAFIEDPVRILRLARFLALFADFTVAPETLNYCRDMVTNGEVDHLVAERVWQELSRALMQSAPHRTFEFLEEIGALERVLPGFIWDREAAELLHLIPTKKLSLAFSYGLLFYRVADIKGFSQRLRAPQACQEAALLIAQWMQAMHRQALATSISSTHMLNTILATDPLRKPERFEELLQSYAVLLALQAKPAEQIDAELAQWRRLLASIQAVDAGAIAKACAAQGTAIKEAVYEARLHALEQALKH
ncbi:Multifunctional CCA protein [Oligella sp. MSHR50489EDL]